MVRRINGARRAQVNSPAALEWALGEGNTTRAKGGPPGGLGLYVLREFVKVNGGTLRVVANDGYLCQHPDAIVRRTLPVEFPGTLIQVELNVRDDKVYTLTPD